MKFLKTRQLKASSCSHMHLIWNEKLLMYSMSAWEFFLTSLHVLPILQKNFVKGAMTAMEDDPCGHHEMIWRRIAPAHALGLFL